MTKARKIELLYNQAKGMGVHATPEEKAELRKYKIDTINPFYVTKSNISAYISAVDYGYRFSFYDWCCNNKRADKRRKGSGAKEMAAYNTGTSVSYMIIGWLTWGMALYWMTHGALTVGSCAIAGAVISFIISRVARAHAMFGLLILPAFLAVYFGSK